MFSTIKRALRGSDYFTIVILAIMAVISYFAVYSATYNSALEVQSAHAIKQVKFFLFGFAGYWFVTFVGYRKLIRYALPFYIVGCMMLGVVLLMGTVGMGAQRWVEIGGLKGQPSEIFKWTWVLMLGWLFGELQGESYGILPIVRKVLWALPPLVLVILQPDLGTSLTYIAAWGIVILFLGLKKRILIVATLAILIIIPVAWGKVLKPYQKMRVITFLEPEKYSSGEGYQAIQSRIAIGSGGITGKGYLKSTQSRLRFMPVGHTDFIFSVISEEFGLLGGGAVIMLFFLLLSRIVYIAVMHREGQAKVMCISVMAFILFQFYVNISMTLGLAPVVGIPLPFISYGGSSLITFLGMMGLVNSAYITRYDKND